jgi:hypothetical protein
MSDCLNKDVKVSSVVYCEDPETGEPDPATAMFSWMAVRAAGPNVLKDTILCGSTEIRGPIPNLCAKSYAPALSVYLDAAPGVQVTEGVNLPVQYYKLNGDNTASFPVSWQMTADNNDTKVDTSWTTPILLPLDNSNPAMAQDTIGVFNNSGQTILAKVTLDFIWIVDTQTNPTFTIGDANLQPYTGASSLVYIVQDANVEKSASLTAIIEIPADGSVLPIWAPAVAVNALAWRACNVTVEVIGCDTATTQGSYQVTPPP